MDTHNHMASSMLSLSFIFEMLGFPYRLGKGLLLGPDHQSKPFKVRVLLPQEPKRLLLARKESTK